MELNKIANEIFNKCAIVGGACSAIVAAAGGGAAVGHWACILHASDFKLNLRQYLLATS